MDWKDMSEAERRRWALEQANLAARLTYGETKQTAFAVAEAMLEFINRGTAKAGSLSHGQPSAPPKEDTRDLRPLEAT